MPRTVGPFFPHLLFVVKIITTWPSFAAGLKNYSKALNRFLYTLTAPTMVVNAITMAAYKRYVLVSLIHAGEPSLANCRRHIALLSSCQG